MKKMASSLALTIGFFTAAQAQPVISDGSNMPPVGFTDSIATIVSATTTPGMAGANINWDFSALAPTVGGVARIVTPSTTPYTSTFPSATYAIELTPNGSPGSAYEYYVITSSKWDIIGNGYSIASGGNYTPNPKLMMPFPFSFNQSVVDTFEKTGSSPGTVTVTYDGYGTLVTPYRTFNNVVRIKREFGGNDYFYDWFSLNPLMIVANYDNNTQKYTFLSTSTVNSIKDITSETRSSVYPNPVTSIATISMSGTNTGLSPVVMIKDVTGRIVKQVSMKDQKATFDSEGLTRGLYFYTIQSKGTALSAGKFLID